MPNVLTTNPIVLDTAGETSALTRAVVIKAIKWDAPGAAGAVCSLHDALNGNLLFEHTALAQNDGGAPLMFRPPLVARGLYLTTLASGKLLVYEA